jgi:hypothetical protein
VKCAADVHSGNPGAKKMRSIERRLEDEIAGLVDITPGIVCVGEIDRLTETLSVRGREHRRTLAHRVS